MLSARQVLLPELRLFLEEPERTAAADADAVGHIPFVFWLMEVLQPRTFVQLGVGAGTFYCAFCQRIRNGALPTSSYGIDLWESDGAPQPETDEMFEELRRYHDSRYSAFSRLVRASSDDFVAGFAGGSLDLIHVECSRPHDALFRDLAGWRSKLNDRAVALFHGINAREPDGGGWGLWNAITGDHAHFSFVHSGGLGVVSLGGTPPDALRELFEIEEREKARIRHVFAGFGERLGRLHAQTRGVEQAERQSQELAESRRRARQLDDQLAAATETTKTLQEQLADRTEECRQLKGAEELSDAMVTALHRELNARLEDCERLTATVARLSEKLREDTEELTARLNTAQQLHRAVLDSTTWKLAFPLRYLVTKARSAFWRLRGKLGCHGLRR